MTKVCPCFLVLPAATMHISINTKIKPYFKYSQFYHLFTEPKQTSLMNKLYFKIKLVSFFHLSDVPVWQLVLSQIT